MALQLLERLSDSWLRKSRCVRRPLLRSDRLVLLTTQEPRFAGNSRKNAPEAWSARIIFGDRTSRICASIVYRPVLGSR